MIGAIVLSILGWGGMGFVLWMTMGSGAGHPVMAFPAVATLYGSKAASAYRGAPFWAAAVPCFGIPAAGLPFLFLQ
ncbi:MAG: hypothetical protein JKY65_00830 [Planctomycetes bacterium]|nr:hypothetical protein [Planctomycetota bacterium]